MALLATGSLIPALFGLIGVAVGAVLTGIVDWIRQSQREDRSAHAAARLLRADLSLAARILRIGIARGQIPGFVDVSLPSWTEYRDVLASALEDDKWIIVAAGCSRLHALAGFNSRLARPRARGRLKRDDRTKLEKMLADVVRAYEALGELAGDETSYERLLEVDPLPPLR
jgi:hypothetical protein